MNEKTCKNCSYRENYTCTKLNEELSIYSTMNIDEVTKKIIDNIKKMNNKIIAEDNEIEIYDTIEETLSDIIDDCENNRDTLIELSVLP